MDYYLQTQDGQQAGPYSIAQMRAFWASGQITLTTPYWSPGMIEWQPVRGIEKLLTAQKPLITASPPVPASSPVKSKRKGLGCGSGCLILVILFVGFIGFLNLLPHEAVQETPQKHLILKQGDDLFALTTGSTMQTFINDCDPSGSLAYQAYTSSLERQVENAQTDFNRQYWSNILTNYTNQAVHQRQAAAQAQYLKDGRAIQLQPGKYTITECYDALGTAITPLNESDVIWVSITYQGKSVYTKIR